ncbi:hypothetical protein Pelo_4185 [Pelomyxa schiedti]|nr:hypothetical protein Pelo_4185 [Pelomyxa schiedti]
MEKNSVHKEDLKTTTGPSLYEDFSKIFTDLLTNLTTETTAIAGEAQKAVSDLRELHQNLSDDLLSRIKSAETMEVAGLHKLTSLHQHIQTELQLYQSKISEYLKTVDALKNKDS